MDSPVQSPKVKPDKKISKAKAPIKTKKIAKTKEPEVEHRFKCEFCPKTFAKS